MLGSETWENDFSSLHRVKELIADGWETRKFGLYGNLMHVLAPSLTLRDGILVTMVTCGVVRMAGVIN